MLFTLPNSILAKVEQNGNTRDPLRFEIRTKPTQTCEPTVSIATSIPQKFTHGTVKLWKIDGTLLNTFSEHSTSVYNVDFNPDGQTLTSASADGIVKVWKPDGTLLKSWTGHNVAVNNISFSPDGSAIASVSDDQTVKFWKPDGTWLATLPGHLGAVRSLSFSPDNKTLASGGDDKTIILWNLEGLEVDGLLKHSCNWLQDYFKNPNVNLSQEDRRVCNGINSSGS